MAPVKCVGVRQCLKCIKLGCKFALLKKSASSCLSAVLDVLDQFADIVEPGQESRCPDFIPTADMASTFPWKYVGMGCGAVVALGGIIAASYYALKFFRGPHRRRIPTRLTGYHRTADGIPEYHLGEFMEMLAPNERARDSYYPNTPNPPRTVGFSNPLFDAASASVIIEPLIQFSNGSEESLFKKTQ